MFEVKKQHQNDDNDVDVNNVFLLLTHFTCQ